LLDEYAYCLREGGRLYTITDVPELADWMARHCSAHPGFDRVPDVDLPADPCTEIMRTYTEEGKKVERNNGPKISSVFVRVSDGTMASRLVGHDFWSYKEDDTNDAEDGDDGGAE
jgi:tRNA (guanine-N7-)-methyltransferase